MRANGRAKIELNMVNTLTVLSKSMAVVLVMLAPKTPMTS